MKYRTSADKDADAILWGVIILIAICFVAWLVLDWRRERNLIRSGDCELIEEGLYDPPPRVSGNRDSIYTTDPDPYWREVYRCPGNEIITRRAS